MRRKMCLRPERQHIQAYLGEETAFLQLIFP